MSYMFYEFFNALKNDIMKIGSEEIQLGNVSTLTLNIIMWSLFIGFVISIGVTVTNRLVIGRLVDKLVEKQAHTEASAVTLAELGISNFLIKFSLRKNGTLRRVIIMSGDTPDQRAATDPSSARFYIPKENIHRAEVVYGKTNASVFSILLSIAAFFIVVLLSFSVVPGLIQMLSNFIAGLTA